MDTKSSAQGVDPDEPRRQRNCYLQSKVFALVSVLSLFKKNQVSSYPPVLDVPLNN